MAPISHIAAIALAGTLASTSLSALPRRTTSAPVLTTEQLDIAAKLRADKAAGFAEADIAQFVKPGRWLQTCRTDKGEPDLVRFMVGHLPGASTSPVLQRVDAAVRHQGQRVQMCYEVLLRTDTRTEHRWSVALAVSATSAVSDVSVSGAEGEFSECVARTMGRTKLPSFSSDAQTLTVRFAGRVAPGDRDSWLVVPGGHCRQREAFRKVRK